MATTARRPATAPRPALTRERIARAALELVDREGLDAFSMRRLAGELDAGTMTLYGHFADKRELLDAVIDVAVAERELPKLTGTWREQARQLILHTREMLRRHPGVVEIWSRQPVVGAVGLRWVEAALEALEAAGFQTAEAVKAFRLLVTYTYGFAFFSAARSGSMDRANVRAALEALPVEQFPHLSGAADVFAEAMGGEDAFRYGLERILDGLEASLDAR